MFFPRVFSVQMKLSLNVDLTPSSTPNNRWVFSLSSHGVPNFSHPFFPPGQPPARTQNLPRILRRHHAFSPLFPPSLMQNIQTAGPFYP